VGFSKLEWIAKKKRKGNNMTDKTEVIETLLPIKYSTNLAFIAKLKDKYMPLEITDLEDKEQLDAVHEARMVMVKVRTTIEKERKAQKAAAIAYGNEVDADAKVLFAESNPIEEHLKIEEDKVINEKKRIEAEDRRMFTLLINGRVESLLKYNVVLPFDEVAGMDNTEFVAKLATAKEAYEAEETRKAEEEKERIARQAELDRQAELQAERDRKLQEKEDALKAQSAAFEKEKREVQEEKDWAEFEAKAKENARIQAEKNVEEALRGAKEKEEKEKAEAERRAALMPDKGKLFAWAEAVEKAVPVVLDLNSKEAKGIFIDAVEVIDDIVEQVKKKARDM